MYKKISAITLVVLISSSVMANDQSVVFNGITWGIFPSNNVWRYAEHARVYGSYYHVLDLPLSNFDSVRRVVGRFSIAGNETTLTYFVLYKIRLLDTTTNWIDANGGNFLKTFIHKIYIHDDFTIPLINIDSISTLCNSSSGDSGCTQWLPISEKTLIDTPGWIDPAVKINELFSRFEEVVVDPLCDSMWAGGELYLSYPINPMPHYNDSDSLNNIYGEYKFVIYHRGGLDSLKPVSGVYSPFFYRCWGENIDGICDNGICYEYDLEFFPRKTRIYDTNNDTDPPHLIWWEKPYLYATTVEHDLPDVIRSISNDTLLMTWDDDTVTLACDTLGDMHVTDGINTTQNKYFYGHYIVAPGAIKDNIGNYHTIKELYKLRYKDGQTITSSANVIIHHAGLGTAFNTLEQPLGDTSTHFFLWLPGEIKAYGYNGNVDEPNTKHPLFHYVRHNNLFNATIFNKDSLPQLKILHSSYYFLILEIAIQRAGLAHDPYIRISWVSRGDVERDGFHNLSSSGSWKAWWQNPHVLLGGEYDSLFADTVGFTFHWKPYMQIFVRGDTLYWNSLPSRGTNVKYIYSEHLSSPVIHIPDTTSDTFAVIPETDSTTYFEFQVKYETEDGSFISAPAVTWYPRVKVYRKNGQSKIEWPACPCADFYEVWWKLDSTSEEWNIDTTKSTSFYPKVGKELAVKVRAVKNQMPMAWGVTGNLVPPSNLQGSLVDIWGNNITLHVTWEDNSKIEDGYWLKYKFNDTWHDTLLAPNSTSCNIYINDANPSPVYSPDEIKIYPILYANPIDRAGDIYMGEGDSVTIFPYLYVISDTSYIVNDLALGNGRKAITIVTSDTTVYTFVENSNYGKNGKGLESCIGVDTDGNFITLWNTGHTLWLQSSSDTGYDSIYSVNDTSNEEIRGIAIDVDTTNNIHIAGLVLNPPYNIYLIYNRLLYGDKSHALPWDTLATFRYNGEKEEKVDLYGIASTLDGSSVVINYSIGDVLYTYKTDAQFIWNNNVNSIYNPVYWPATGKFWFPYVDNNDTLRFMSIDSYNRTSSPDWGYHYSNNSQSVYAFIPSNAPDNLSLALTENGSPFAISRPIARVFLFRNDSGAFSQVATAQIDTTGNIDRLLGFISSIETEIIPDTHKPHIDTLLTGYISYKGNDSFHYLESFRFNISGGSVAGGPQGTGNSMLPSISLNKIVLNGKKDKLELIIFSPNPEDEIVAYIYDIAGRELWRKQIVHTENRVYKVPISLKHLPQGVYFVHVKIGNRVFTRRILSIK